MKAVLPVSAIIRASALILLSLFLSGCGENSSSRDDLAPSAPVPVERTADQDYAQRGIRADPGNHDAYYAVRIEWYPNPEDDVKGYIIQRYGEFGDEARAPAVADLRVGVIQPENGIYSWVDTDPALAPASDSLGYSRGYYWQIIAYDEAGNRSPRSRKLYYRLVNNPLNTRVVRDGPGAYRMAWQYVVNPDVVLNYFYVFRVYSAHYGRDSLVWFLSNLRSYEAENWVALDFSGISRPMVFDCTYVWQINVVANGWSSSHADTVAGSAVATTFTYLN